MTYPYLEQQLPNDEPVQVMPKAEPQRAFFDTVKASEARQKDARRRRLFESMLAAMRVREKSDE